MMQPLFVSLFSFATLTMTLVWQGCHGPQGRDAVVDTQTTSFPYSFKDRIAYTVPDRLEEISGISYLSAFPKSLFAIQDEEGILFTFDLDKKEVVREFVFGDRGDYEDVTTDGRFFFVLKSDGEIYSFPVQQDKNTIVKQQKELLPKGEYESMAFDAVSKQVYVLCKNCKNDRKSKSVTAYSFAISADGKLSKGQTFAMDLKTLGEKDKRLSKSFKPSALARNEVRKEWYVISSVDKVLVVFDNDFQPKDVVRFDRKTFEQPEGMVFDKEGKLYISSEAGNLENGFIYQLSKEEGK